jgi:Tfp pilus assembly protein PilN
MINVNLLPPDIKEEIAQTKKNGQIVKVFWKLIFLILIYLLLSGGFYYWFSLEQNKTANELAKKEEEIKKYGILEQEAKNIADRLNTIKQIQSNTFVWSGTIDEIMTVVPTGVSLKSVKIDSVNKNRNQITGDANTKTEVASLRDSLEKSNKFQYVDIEASTTIKDPAKNREYENFTISFSLEKGALK